MVELPTVTPRIDDRAGSSLTLGERIRRQTHQPYRELIRARNARIWAAISDLSIG